MLDQFVVGGNRPEAGQDMDIVMNEDGTMAVAGEEEFDWGADALKIWASAYWAGLPDSGYSRVIS
jgi:hypothetical protein